MRRGLLIGAVTVPLLLSAGIARAAPLDPACSYPAPYPGDMGDQAAIAGWMAHGAKARGIPPELPVMGALAESGLRNLPDRGNDRAGYFQMQRSVWDKGPYAGFTSNPDLQLGWFVDYALAVRQQRIDGGDPDFGQSELEWGAWIADVLLPPENLRGQYQARLEEARGLIEQSCSLPTVDDMAPAMSFVIHASQRVRRVRGVVVRLACPAEDCLAAATALVSVPGAARAYSARSRFVGLERGETVRLRIAFRPALMARVRRALRRGARVRAKVTVGVLDAAGNGTSRTIRLRLA